MLQQAEKIYKTIIKDNPEHADALHLTGVVAIQTGNYESAVVYINRAIQINPDQPFYYSNLGNAFQGLGKHTTARVCYEKALQIKPDFIDACFNLANTFLLEGQLKKAVLHYQKVLALDPKFPEAHNNMGKAMQDIGNLKEAIICYQKAVELNPDYADAFNNMGNALRAVENYEAGIQCYREALRIQPAAPDVYYNMGNLLQDQEKFEQALDCYCKVLQIAPDHFDACNNLGKTLQDLNRNEEALTHYQKALAMRPDNADALYNLGNVFKEQGHLTQAIEYYRLALRQKPDYVEVHNNMGNAFQKAEYFETAVKCYQQALRYKPQYAVAWNNLGKTFQELGRLNEAKMACNQALLYDSQNPEAHFNHAIALLLNAELEKGWNEYEWRFLTDDWQNIYPYRIDLPRWQGESFAGQKLFVHSEQGLGDTLQFIRYLPWVKSKGGLVIFETMKSLHPILQNYPGIDQLVEMSTRPNPTAEFDIYIPLLSLPGVFQSNLDTIPDAVPYIQADKSLAERWRDKFTTTDFKVGLVWAGKPSHKNDHNRSISPEQFIPLSRIDSLSLYGLQKGKAATQFAGIKNRFPIQNLGQSLQNFADTAAVVANLDLVISVDTSVAHLAGAMGKAVWTLLPYIPDWRWMMDREDSPWYPTMRLFRQPQRGNWDAVIQRVAEELKKLLEGG